jgi:hypothetical protein
MFLSLLSAGSGSQSFEQQKVMAAQRQKSGVSKKRTLAWFFAALSLA